MKNTAEYLTKKIYDLGYTLVVKHYRYDKRVSFRKMQCRRYSPVGPIISSNFSSRGGWTVATVYDKEGWTVCMGIAVCSSKDNFNKKIGWIKAVGRAYGMIPAIYHVPFKSGETIVANK